MRSFILAIAAIGLLVFGTAFSLSFANSTFIETTGKALIRKEVERRVAAKLDALRIPSRASAGEHLGGLFAADLDAARKQLADALPAKVAQIAARMSDPNCECRRAIDRGMNALMDARFASLARLDERLATMIRTRYVETVEQLIREFRIFTGANALVFGLLGVVTLMRRQARLQLVLPALVLLGSAGLTAFFYLFQQDWFHTVVFSDYVGLSYFAYLSIAAALLGDIAFNRGRVSRSIVSAVGNIVGSVSSIEVS